MTGTRLDIIDVTLGEMIRPMPGKLAVLINTKDEITPQGLFIPRDLVASIHEQRPTSGKVVAIGDEGEDSSDPDSDLQTPPRRVSLGDTVLFGKYSGTKISWQNPTKRDHKEEVVILLERDILAVLISPEQAANIKVKS